MAASVDMLLEALPVEARPLTAELLTEANITIKITPKRKTKHGDFRIDARGGACITLNASKNPYQFLITLLHELAHWFTYKKYGRRVKPHGKEWKHSFQHIALPFLQPAVFPEPLLSLLALHLKNPKATSSSDLKLASALRAYDPPKETVTVLEIAEGDLFSLDNGRVFVRGKKRVKRILCTEVRTRRVYLFSAVAEVYKQG